MVCCLWSINRSISDQVSQGPPIMLGKVIKNGTAPIRKRQQYITEPQHNYECKSLRVITTTTINPAKG